VEFEQGLAMVFDTRRLTRRLLNGASVYACAVALFAASAPAGAQNVLPTGGSVASGSASISQSSHALSVTQTTPRAIVNWNGFSIGQSNSVTFVQPNASSAILNRVTGATPSTIAGQLDANGQVYLVNPNGIAITRSGTVQAGGGFVGSTLAITNKDFNDGNLSFSGDGASAAVSNAGSIAVAPGGIVGLLGGSVSNSGVVSVPLGKVGMGSGEKAALDLTGDNFLQVAVPSGAKTADGKALVDVSGKIHAAGGMVRLKAATVATAIRDAVNVSGIVSARSARASGGSIILDGGPGGEAFVSGRLDASGRAKGGAVRVSGRDAVLKGARVLASSGRGKGGSVAISAGNAVRLLSSSIDASGAAGGGAIRIGGNSGGANSLPRARNVSIDAGTALDANATSNGDGGAIVVWSDDRTAFAGHAEADGGTLGGNGGTVETSSAGVLTIGQGASVSAKSTFGAPGIWRVDPFDLTIDAAAATTIEGTLNGGTDVLEQTTAVGTTGSGVVSSGNGEITVAAPITWTSTATLTLSAFDNIFINAAISGANGSLQLQATNNITQAAGASIAAAILGATSTNGMVTLTEPTNNVATVSGSAPLGFSFVDAGPLTVDGISASGGPITLTSGDTIDIQTAVASGSGAVTLTATNDIGQSSVAGIGATTLSATSTNGKVVLTADENVVGSISGSGPLGFSFANAEALSVGAAGIRTTTGSISLLAQGVGDITQAGPITGAALSAIATGGSVALTNPDNSVATIAGSAGCTAGCGSIPTAFGSFHYANNVANLAIGTVNFFQSTRSGASAFSGVETGVAGSTISVANVGGLTIGAAAQVLGETGGVLLAATGAFTNNVGAGAITAPVGVFWQVFSAAPTGDTFRNLNSRNTAVWNTPSGGTVTAAGNRYIFAFQPTITFTSINDAKTYGVDDTSTVATDFTVGAAQSGVAGAFVGDTLAAAFTGTPSVTSTGAPATAAVSGSPYAINVGAGSLAALDGYGLVFASLGALSVAPRTLTYAVADANGTYGTTATLGAATLTGVLAGDVVTPTVGAFSGATQITLGPKTPVGPYSEQVTALSNSNYVLAASGNTPGTLTISPLALTYSVANANGTYGTTATLGAATLNGVVAGDVVTPTVGAFLGATPITLGAKTPVGLYGEQVTTISNPNYVLAVSGNTPGTLTISPLALTYSVANADGTYGTTATLGAATLNGVLAGDIVTATVGAFTGDPPITLGPRTPAGVYSEQVTALSNPNYTIATSGNAPGTLTISPLALTYAVANANSTYGTTATLGAATLNGVLTGDVVTATVGAFSGDPPITLGPKTPVGAYSEQVTALSNPNYTIAASGNAPGTLTISPLALTYSVANATGIFGTTATLGAATLNGVLAGDTVIPTVGAFTGATPIALSPTTPVGTYAERVTAISNPNYSLAASGNTPGALTIVTANVSTIAPSRFAAGFLPALVNGASDIGDLNFDRGADVELLPVAATGCETSPALPNPKLFKDPVDAVKALSRAVKRFVDRCDNLTKNRIADVLDQYAAGLSVVAPKLPPEWRNIPLLVSDAARRVRAAPSKAAAVAVLSQTMTAIRKQITLMRADDPNAQKAETASAEIVAGTINAVSIALVRSEGL
jgi:filamentous hemagglutinin family protein